MVSSALRATPSGAAAVATLGACVVSTRGYRIPMTVGAILLVVGASGAALGILPWAVGAAVGLGTGAVTAAALALMQDQAPPRQLGVATSSATLLRNLGAAAGINGLAALSTSSGAARGTDRRGGVSGPGPCRDNSVTPHDGRTLSRSLPIRPQSRLSGLCGNSYVLLGVCLLLVGWVKRPIGQRAVHKSAAE